MKLGRNLKLSLIGTLGALYASGFLTWLLSNWFFVNSGLGPEPSANRTFWLEVHGVLGYAFAVLFGYLWHAHVRPSWRRPRRRWTGAVLTGTLILLLLSVPGLYYVGREAVKAPIVFAHTYLGLALIVPFLSHWLRFDWLATAAAALATSSGSPK